MNRKKFMIKKEHAYKRMKRGDGNELEKPTTGISSQLNFNHKQQTTDGKKTETINIHWIRAANP